MDTIIKEKRLIQKNLVFISLAFLLVYSAYYALEGLQSSLNESGSLGVVAVSFIYGGYFVSVVYASFVIDVLGTKKTLVGAFLAHTLFVVSNFYPTWWSLIPASLILGLVAAPQWTAQGVMVSRLAIRYAWIMKSDQDAVLTKFTGMFGAAVFISVIPGALVSSIFLTKSDQIQYIDNYDRVDFINGSFRNTSYLTNETYFTYEFQNTRQCGSLYCPNFDHEPSSNTTASNSPVTKASLYLVLGIYLGVNITGVMVTAFLVKNVKSAKEKKLAMLKDLYRLLVDPILVAILIIVMFYACSNSLVIAIFTNSFIACSLGVTMVGYGYACYTVGRSLGCIISGILQRYIHRAFHFAFVFLTFTALLVVWLLWIPTDQDIVLLYVMSFLIGFINGTIDTQTKSLLGNLFAHKLSAAFSLRCFADGFGHAVALVYMGFFCARTVLYIHIGALACSVLAYAFIEIKQKMRPSVHETVSTVDANIEDKNGGHVDVEIESLKIASA